ncbi:tRNA-uridine aminocarboxypropyltransferase [Bdellovibrio svalbardensis]|uniref:tRNA-uridine aminocarboxypropyltransferase n=1 Tax=Bdellovibrio svalbardensis TaxID=2972972 RepID=A0ABT6DHT2_9BACT|nr:tRNA-uridine aminocarboxypropyltransferase [Bdellovibrio svalbardensis]MDG0816416.1 DTW domain-containing protein [Bdellovibrio svalbardensis]
MNLQTYLQARLSLAAKQSTTRVMCAHCLQPDVGCYCPSIQRFDPGMEFVILIHPIEVRRRIATGRMSSLCLENSHMISGEDYSNNAQVNALIADPDFHSVILYPGADSKDLTPMTETEKAELFPVGRKLRIFVIDGTWATAKKMVRKSANIKALPKICFSPAKPSNFRVRRQPNTHCFSTIEAIHQSIELLGSVSGFNTASRCHDNLLQVFDKMVERQLDYVKDSYARSGKDPLSRERKRQGDCLA